ncbi:MAG: hypothetical protein LBD99_00560, partial [Candidatus Margulisbacteria bacterium]|nr:hypothetical protein [Candidatus Margulisiibacteriota bacterium]
LFRSVLDSGSNKITRVRLDSFKKSDSFGDLRNPYGLAVDIYGNIYAADTGADRIVKYSPSGKLLLSFGRRGSLPGELLLPQDVAVGLSKKIYVADTGNKSVQIFSETGAYLGELKQYAGQEVRSLDFAGGVLWLSLVNKSQPESLSLGYQLKELRQNNEYFSPNGDGVKDETVFQLKLESPAAVQLEIFSGDELVERLDASGSKPGELRLSWAPKNPRQGGYDYFLFAADPEGNKEPACQTGKIYLDLRPPDIETLLVSPDVLSDKSAAAVMQARSREPAALSCQIYDADKQLVYTAAGAEYRFAPSLSWDGRNKFQELKNGKYRAAITLTDQAGNSTSARQRDIFINIEHPIIDLAEAAPKYIQEKQPEKLTLRLLRFARVSVYIRGASGQERLLLERELARGEHILDIPTGALESALYTLRVYAEAGEYQDESFSGFAVDGIPPALDALTLSPAEIWSGGIDEAALAFTPNEDITARIELLAGQTAETLTPEISLAAAEECVYIFNGNRPNGAVLPSGDYALRITARDLAGNVGVFEAPLRITADGPAIKHIMLKPDILSREALLYRLLNINYELGGSTGPLYLTAKLYRNGALYKTIAERERRPRGFQFDQIYADQNMPEGGYTYEYLLEDSFNHKTAAEGSFFYVASAPRILSLSQSEPAISPINQDGLKDYTILNFSLQSPEYLAYYAAERPDFSTLKVYFSVGGELAQEHTAEPGGFQIIWDGRDAAHKYIRDGIYEYEIKAADALGVFSAPVTGAVIVANSREKIAGAEILVNNSAADSEIFNPLEGAATATVNIYLKDFPLRQQLILSLYDSKDNLVETYPARDFTVSQNYPFVITDFLSDGWALSPGAYRAQLKIIDEVGNDFDYVIGSALNYSDVAGIVGYSQPLAKTAVEKNSISGEYEVSYMYGDPVRRSVDAQDSTSDEHHHANYFYLDHPQAVCLRINDHTNEKIGSARIWKDGVLLEEIENGGDKNVYLDAGNYFLDADCHNAEQGHSVWGYVDFDLYDVRYRNFYNKNVEYTVDPDGLDTGATYAAQQRARRLALITQNAFTADYAHTVTNAAGRIYYQRRKNGETSGTAPLLLSHPQALASDPSICAGDDNSVYAVWVEQKGGAYAVYAVHIPEKYLALRADPADSPFTLAAQAVPAAVFADAMSAAGPLAVDKQINYPNPFAERTTIRYRLSRDAEVAIRIYDAAGRPARRLDFFPGTEGGRGATAGDPYNDVVWDGANDYGQSVLNGAYIYEITAGDGERAVKARGKMLKWR